MMRFVLAAGVITVGCGSAPPTPRRLSEAAARCTLEAVIGEMPELQGARRCPTSNGVCDLECAEAIRGCVLDAARARQPVVAIWTGNYIDGVGRRHAVLAHEDGAAYRIGWLEYELVGLDVNRHRIVSQDCAELLDQRALCAAGGEPRICGPDRAHRTERLELGCVPAAEAAARPVCDEPLTLAK